MKTLLCFLSLTVAVGCSMQSQPQNELPQVLASNIAGVMVAYKGDTLREADLAARHQCERYNRGAALVNDIQAGEGQSFAYYYCQ